VCAGSGGRCGKPVGPNFRQRRQVFLCYGHRNRRKRGHQDSARRQSGRCRNVGLLMSPVSTSTAHPTTSSTATDRLGASSESHASKRARHSNGRQNSRCRLFIGWRLGNFALARFNSNGTLDTTFDGDGIAVLALLDSQSIFDIAIEPDGKITAVGNTENSPAFDFMLARLKPTVRRTPRLVRPASAFLHIIPSRSERMAIFPPPAIMTVTVNSTPRFPSLDDKLVRPSFESLDCAKAESVFDKNWKWLSVSDEIRVGSRIYTYTFGCRRENKKVSR
jgi:hypothetical protein